MIYLLLSCILLQPGPGTTDEITPRRSAVSALRFDQLPGYDSFQQILARCGTTDRTFVVIHEESAPDLIRRLFLLAQAVTPEHENARIRAKMEEDFVQHVLQSSFGVKMLYLRKKATDRLFYSKLNTSRDSERIIIFTNLEKLNLFREVQMDSETAWYGLVAVIQLKDGEPLIMGERIE